MDKTRRGILIAIQLLLFIYAILVGVRCLVDPDYNKYGGFLAGMLLPFLPNLIDRTFKCHIPFRIELLYYIFLFIALDMGICMDLYKTTPFFDKAVHFGSGILSALVGYYALIYFKAWHTPRLFKALFIMFFSISIGVLWEFFEFACDKFLGQSMQQLVSTGVDDTMFDLLAATVGAAIGGFIMAHPRIVKFLEEK